MDVMPNEGHEKPIRLLLVDDHQLLRDGLRLRLGQEADMQVVGEASTALQAMDALEKLAPALVVLDVELPDTRGMELTRRILERAPGTRVLILSGHSNEELLKEAIEAGISGYVLKAEASQNLVEAIRTVAADRMYLSAELASAMVSGYRRLLGTKAAAGDPGLSAREVEVLRLVAEGHNTKEIAARLELSAKTVETYRLRVMEKLGLRSVAELTKYAIRKGLTSV